LELRYTFTGSLWEHQLGDAPWVFVTLPVDDGEEIAELVPRTRGFGSIRVAARIGATEWSTSIFPDKASGSFVLPVKKAVRAGQRLHIGDEAEVSLTIVFEA
jgi:Domain of unknown function (DUF1905)